MAERGDIFNSAKWFDTAPDNETLSAGSVEEAIEYALECIWKKGITDDEWIDALCPVTVYAFNPKEIDPRFARMVVDSWMEDFDETHWCEDYGNFEGPSDETFNDEAALREELTAVLQRHIDTAHVWQCEQVAKREFSKAEVRELLADYLGEPRRSAGSGGLVECANAERAEMKRQSDA